MVIASLKTFLFSSVPHLSISAHIKPVCLSSFCWLLIFDSDEIITTGNLPLSAVYSSLSLTLRIPSVFFLRSILVGICPKHLQYGNLLQNR